MRKHGTSAVANSQVSAAFSRKLSLSLLGVFLLMVATLIATVWMARQQDIAAQAASRQMVVGGLKAFVERTKVTLLDYAIWTDAYNNILAGNIGWIKSNVSEFDAFDLVVVQPPHAAALGWDAGEGPRADLLEPEAIAIVNRLLDDVPVNQAGVSHISFYNSVAPVPLPAAAWLLIAGLGGIAAVARKRKAAAA